MRNVARVGEHTGLLLKARGKPKPASASFIDVRSTYILVAVASERLHPLVIGENEHEIDGPCRCRGHSCHHAKRY